MVMDQDHGGEDSEVLLVMYRNQADQARHYEIQRDATSRLILAGAILILGAATTEILPQTVARLVPAILVAIALLGTLNVALHYRRSARHGAFARAHRNRLDALHPSAGINKDRTRIDAELGRKPLSQLRLHHLWHMVHGLVAVAGLLMAYRIATG